jgi:hypothetical protein
LVPLHFCYGGEYAHHQPADWPGCVDALPEDQELRFPILERLDSVKHVDGRAAHAVQTPHGNRSEPPASGILAQLGPLGTLRAGLGRPALAIDSDDLPPPILDSSAHVSPLLQQTLIPGGDSQVDGTADGFSHAKAY